MVGVGTKLSIHLGPALLSFKNFLLSQILGVTVFELVWTSDKMFKELIQFKMQRGGPARLDQESYCCLLHAKDINTFQVTLKLGLQDIPREDDLTCPTNTLPIAHAHCSSLVIYFL